MTAGAGLAIAFRHDVPGFTAAIDLAAPTPGTLALFGPSGCGKSTLAAVVAGLLRPDSGRVVLDGTVLFDSAAGVCLPPERRRVGMVFQTPNLFPHLTVAGNLRYGQRRAGGGGPGGNDTGFDDVVALLGLESLLARRPRTLSGGERQRVAIGRALLSQPRLLVMDEPLSSLDGPRKDEILPYLARLKQALRLPILYITHDLAEVARLADWLALMEAGRVRAVGPLDEIAVRGDLPLALRDDAGAMFAARVQEHDAARQLTTLAAGAARLLVPLLAAAPGTMVRLRVPAREVILATDAPRGISVHNVLATTIRTITEDPPRRATLVAVDAGGAALLARVTPDAVARLGLVPGAAVLALVKSMAIEVFSS